MSDIILPISRNPASTVTEPVRGDRRLVKQVQTPFGMAPCIWITPYTFQDEIRAGEIGPCRKCCVLLNKGDAEHPRPEVVWMTVPDFLLNHPSTPEVPVEW
jgi:hypothetical protein